MQDIRIKLVVEQKSSDHESRRGLRKIQHMKGVDFIIVVDWCSRCLGREQVTERIHHVVE